MSSPRGVVAGNWKMHVGPDEARAFLAALSFRTGPQRPSVLLFPPAVSVATAAWASGGRVAIGVQNIHWEDEGAFTGETSARIARQAGATHALVGHSERRQLFGETDADVALKAEAALRNGLLSLWRALGWASIADALRHYAASAQRALHLLTLTPARP